MRSLVLTALAVLLSAGGLPMHAQRVEPPACTYDACALRIESGKLVRGVSGEKVERLGIFFSADVAKHVAQSDSAVIYARMYERNHSPGMMLTFVGEGVALAALGWFEGGWNVGYPSISTTRGAIAVGGFAIMLYGANRLNKASRGLARDLVVQSRPRRGYDPITASEDSLH